MSKLLSTPALVEAPFIICKIGDYTFGKINKVQAGNALKVTFPEYMSSINVVKYNGQVNTYTVRIDYPIQKGADPNLMEYVFSSVSSTRRMVLSYGDWSSPSFIYKEENTLITNVSSSISFSSPKIQYTITAVSDALSLQSVNYNFPYRKCKPSDEIFRILQDKTYGLSQIFPGMLDISKVKSLNLIASDDQEVELSGAQSTDVLSYLKYLVGCMVPLDAGTDIAGTGFYKLNIVDDNKNQLEGSYFKVTKISAYSSYVVTESNTNSGINDNSYEIDIGYPGDNLVSEFSIGNNSNWSILYDAANKVDIQNYSYKIDEDGNLVKNYSPSLTRTSSITGTTAEDRSWWTEVTRFPITASITFRGLVRPSTLMDTIKLNVVFFGQRHIASGYYIITKETDSISDNGYKTTLELTRTGGDDETGSITQIKDKSIYYNNGSVINNGEGRSNSDTTQTSNLGTLLNPNSPEYIARLRSTTYKPEYVNWSNSSGSAGYNSGLAGNTRGVSGSTTEVDLISGAAPKSPIVEETVSKSGGLYTSNYTKLSTGEERVHFGA